MNIGGAIMRIVILAIVAMSALGSCSEQTTMPEGRFMGDVRAFWDITKWDEGNWQ